MFTTWILFLIFTGMSFLLGMWIGVHIGRSSEESEHETRVNGPGLPTEESEADDWMKKGGW